MATFSVRASQEQAYRWQRAASADGFQSAGSWLAYAADAFLKARARAALPVPLAWSLGRFRVVLDGQEVDVRGMVSPPFAHFQGSIHGPDTNKPRTLVNLRTGQIIATLRSARLCRQLASELAPLLARDEMAGVPVIRRHIQEQA